MTDVPAEGNPSTITIQKFEFSIPARYTAGHSLSANEAAALNQMRLENIRNNQASRIKTALEDHVKAGGSEDTFDLDAITVPGEGDGAAPVPLRQSILDYAETYEFGVRKARASTAEPADPIDREAFRMASDVVKEALRGKGVKVKDLPEGRYDELVKTYAAKDSVRKEAQRRVKEKAKIGAEELDIDLSGIGDEPAEPEAAAAE